MIKNPRLIRIDPDRIGVADEMDVMAAIGQLEPELGGHDPAAAVRWIAGDSDPHGLGTSFAVPIRPCRFSAGAATSPPPNQTRTVSPSSSTDGSQSTLSFQGSEPAKTAGSFSHATPSAERAKPRRRYSRASRPV